MVKGLNSFISKRNKQGIFIFIGICLCVIFVPRVLAYLTPKEKFDVASNDIEVLQENQIKNFHHKKFRKKDYQKRYKIPQGRFNPNTYSVKDWMYLGMSEKQANVVMKFTSRGIYSNEQLQKIFVISDDLFQLIKDSTFYPTKSFEKKEVQKFEKKVIFIDVNNASQEELETIPGIGTFYAKNIIKYRDRLGGFCKKEQLLEVWKMEIEKYTEVESHFNIISSNIKKLHLNSATSEQLKAHPYFTWNIANSIIKMRDQKGGFKKIEEIKESVLIDEELFEKLKPYLSL